MEGRGGVKKKKSAVTDEESACCFLAHIVYLCLWGQEASCEMNERQQSGGRR